MAGNLGAGNLEKDGMVSYGGVKLSNQFVGSFIFAKNS